MPMAPDATPRRYAALPLRVAFVLGVMACGSLVLYIALPPRRTTARPTTRPLAHRLTKCLAEGVRIEPGRWRTIVVHHSATSEGNAERFHLNHLYERHWEGGLGYHFVIGNGHGSGDGEIEIGGRWPEQKTGIHARGHNAGAIGICLVGNFEDTPPSKNQMDALTDLVRCLLDLCGLEADDVYMHGDLVATACPGRHFPAEAFRAALAEPRPTD